jgi:enoyl-CoA hydratase/carnithine racemase
MLRNLISVRNPYLMTQARFFSTAGYQNILTETREGSVGLITLNRPKALNALCHALYVELIDAARNFDKDPAIHAIVLTGSQKAFAAGADIKEMEPQTYPNTYSTDMLTWWDDLTKLKKPLIGAVNGYALGGGSELAMMCDILIAGKNAKFGQPEVKLGTIPGMGGTQRLTHAIGKSRAMELILTGDMMDAEECWQRGLVSRVVEPEQTVDEAVKIGLKIAQYSQPSISIAKECVNMAFEMPLTHGLLFERRVFQATFGSKDQKEGMNAFANKRKANWTHQ